MRLGGEGIETACEEGGDVVGRHDNADAGCHARPPFFTIGSLSALDSVVLVWSRAPFSRKTHERATPCGKLRNDFMRGSLVMVVPGDALCEHCGSLADPVQHHISQCRQ